MVVQLLEASITDWLLDRGQRSSYLASSTVMNAEHQRIPRIKALEAGGGFQDTSRTLGKYHWVQGGFVEG